MTPSQPNPTEWEQETTKALNALAVECAFGVIDREDLPRLVTEALETIRKATSEAIGDDITPDQIPHHSPYISGVNGTKRAVRKAIGIKDEAA